MLSSAAPSGWQVSLPFPVEPGTRWKGSDPGQGAISRVSPVVVEQRPEPTPEALPSPGPSEHGLQSLEAFPRCRCGPGWPGGVAAGSRGLSYEKGLFQPCLCQGLYRKPNTDLGNVNISGLPPGIWCPKARRRLWGTLQPPTDKKLQAIYNTAGRSWANISCPLPTPLDLQAVCLNSHWANRSQISAEIRGTVRLR